MREVVLINSALRALVDDEDYERLPKCNWILTPNGYVFTSRNRGERRMHRIVMGACCGQIVDHINRNRRDNRKGNLRFATPLGNTVNAKLRCDNTSGYRGVSWQRKRKAWSAEIVFAGKHRWLGYFGDAHAAALAYDIEAARLFGEYAHLNFPQGLTDIATGVAA